MRDKISKIGGERERQKERKKERETKEERGERDGEGKLRVRMKG